MISFEIFLFVFLHFEYTVLICRSYSIFPAWCLLSFLDLGLVSVINFGKVSAGTASTITCPSPSIFMQMFTFFKDIFKGYRMRDAIFPLSIVEMLCHFLLASSVLMEKFTSPHDIVFLLVIYPFLQLFSLFGFFVFVKNLTFSYP